MTANAGAPSLADAHAALLRDGALQFALPSAAPEPPPAPPWLPSLAFGDGGAVWVLAALGAALVVALAVSYLRGRPPAAAEAAPGSAAVAVAPAAARLALGDADRLAAAGRHLDAARTLLHCGLDAIAERHPGLLRPTTTSRDLAGAAALPDGTRLPFGRIAQAVERGLFGGRAVAAEDYAACRSAFLEAAFAPGGSGGPA